MPESTGREGSAPLSEKGRRSKRTNRRKRAKQWTFLIEKLKLTVDGLYEMCREEQNLNACKEALMYLQNSSRDFESLIDSINVELSWEEKEKPQAVAWEIRKSMSSPSPVVMKEASSIINQMTPLMFSEVVKAASERKKAVGGAASAADAATAESDKDEVARQIAAIDAAVDSAKERDDWQVVLRGRRKKSLSSMTSESRDDLDTVEHTTAARPSNNVYERLAAGGRRYPSNHSQRGHAPASLSTNSNSSNYMCPKSAMDLPQTKASMAKMAYSRQLLWQRTQSTLMEKMKARQSRQRNADFSGGTNGGTRARVTVEGGEGRGGGGGEKKTETASETSRNLASIRETMEDEKGEPIPLDPKPSSEGGRGEERMDETPLLLASSTSAPPTITRGEEEEGRLSFPLSNPELLNLECDREWREMTEEEESLAFEERSLNIEIEQAKNLSIDAELERQVAAEADELEREEEEERLREEEERRAEEEREEEEEEVVVEEQKEEKVEYEEMFRRWQEEIAELATVSWSDLVERELANAPTTHLREPGDAAVRHERMMSPSRKRSEYSEEDLSRRHEEKQRRADELRERLKEEKASRLKGLLQKVEEVREKRAALIERKRALMESRLKTAKENRDRNLEEIVRKAREDEAKVMEAQLIHTLEKGNMRLDQQMREQRNESRRQEIAEERVKRHEEKAAKEAAAEGRRRANDTRSESSALSLGDETAAEEEQRVETPVEMVEEREEEEVEQSSVEEPDKKEVVEEEEKKEEMKADEKKRRKSNKEKESEKVKEVEEEVKRGEDVAEIVEKKEYPWAEMITAWTAGKTMLSSERRVFECGWCGLEQPSEWEAVGHLMECGRGGERTEMEEGGEGEERRRAVIASLEKMLTLKETGATVKKESGPVAVKQRKKKKGGRGGGGGDERREDKRQRERKEMVEGMARAMGGGCGPSIDLWREMLTAGEMAAIGEEEGRELLTVCRAAAQRKKAGEAAEAFVQHCVAAGAAAAAGPWTAPPPGMRLLSAVVDAVLQVLTTDRSIRDGTKRREEKEAKEIDDAAFGLLRLVAKAEALEPILSTTRSLRLLSVLLQRVDAMRGERRVMRKVEVVNVRPVSSLLKGRAGASSTTTSTVLQPTLQPVVLELLQRVAMIGGGEMEHLLLILDAVQRVATLPVAHLIQSPSREMVGGVLVGMTLSNKQALAEMKKHLSPWHVVRILKAELDRSTCSCPLHTVLPTRESITEAVRYYEQAM